jgi:hypothetical protein
LFEIKGVRVLILYNLGANPLQIATDSIRILHPQASNPSAIKFLSYRQFLKS